jgi:hypothetical protein
MVLTHAVTSAEVLRRYKGGIREIGRKYGIRD